MPTYEYRCRDCRHELEAQQSFSDDPLTTCPSCGGTLKKKFSSVGISFKGSGFYKTDSRASTSAGKGKATADTSTGSSDGAPADTPASSSASTGKETSGTSDGPSSGASSSGSSSSGSSSSGGASSGSAPAKAAAGA